MSNSKTSTAATTDQLIEQLAQALKAPPFGVEEIDVGGLPPKPAEKKEGDGKSSEVPRVVCLARRPKLAFQRVGFEVTPDLCVCDDVLGSLGLVFVLTVAKNEENEENEENEKKATLARLEFFIDQASYVRHLLLTDDSANDYAPRPVELVVMVREDGRGAELLGEHLRKLSQQTSYLHAISVNLLKYKGGESDPVEVPPEGVRAAFSWLLPKTRDYLTQPSERSKVPKRGRALRKIELENYRLSSGRSLELKPKQRIHVVHGHNGSGKSTLVEALEIATTGEVERIKAACDQKTGENYRSVIANDPSKPVKVVLYREPPPAGDAKQAAEGQPEQKRAEKRQAGSQEKAFTVGANGVVDPLNRQLDARSFRLNQPLMDLLTGADEFKRAETFLRAFFPKEAGAIERHEKAVKKWEAARQALEAFAPVTDTYELELRKARRGESASLPWTTLLQPLASNHVDALEWLSSELSQRFEDLNKVPAGEWSLRDEPSPPAEILEHLDSALIKVQVPASERRSSLARADQLRQRLANWTARGTGVPGAHLASVIQEWLKFVALADLGEQFLSVVDTLKEANTLGWESQSGEGLELAKYMPSQSVEELRPQVEKWRERRDEYESLVKSESRNREQVSGSGTGPAARVPILTPPDVQALDDVGSWVLGKPGFGKAIREALEQQSPREFAQEYGSPIHVGKEGWTTQWGARVQALQAVYDLDVGTHGALTRLEKLREAAKAAHEKEEAKEKVGEEFGRQLESLKEPLNELLRVFTPARWAYPETELRSDTDDQGKQKLQMRANGKARADLRYNTAELNTLTIALFLLCAPRLNNPLNTLVLDDPFQNMDQLTVVTVLRGLVRVSRLLPYWQVLILIHSEETLELARRELACAIYRLPWLTPGGAEGAATQSIQADPLNVERELELQPLGLVLQARAGV